MEKTNNRSDTLLNLKSSGCDPHFEDHYNIRDNVTILGNGTIPQRLENIPKVKKMQYHSYFRI